MNYSKQLSVFVPTHIIDADTKPYLNNEMIEKTVLSAYERLGLDGVKFFIYPDAKFKRTHPKLSNLYYDNLNFTFSKSEFDNVEVIVVDDSRETMRNNWQKFIEEDCDTPYMLFLEHDWEFLEDIPLDKILNTFEKNPDMGYIKFNKSAIDNNMRNLSSWHNWDLIVMLFSLGPIVLVLKHQHAKRSICTCDIRIYLNCFFSVDSNFGHHCIRFSKII